LRCIEPEINLYEMRGLTINDMRKLKFLAKAGQGHLLRDYSLNEAFAIASLEAL